MSDRVLRERLAELEHDQWVEWSSSVAARETLSPERVDRWQKLWRPYSELTEAEKDQDRVWADKVIRLVWAHFAGEHGHGHGKVGGSQS